MIIRYFFIFAFTVLSSSMYSQYEPITLTNPSLEGVIKSLEVPVGWYNCGNEISPPDIHPDTTFKKDYLSPKDGNTYIGMVVRENDSWEGLAQRLSSPLEPGVCYELTMYLARSDKYISGIDGKEDKKFNFNKPAVIRIWGGRGYCEKDEKLSESAAVKNTQWKKYRFILKPTKRIEYIKIEAFYKTPLLVAYNGNVLIDDISDIIPIDCDSNQPLSVKETPIEDDVIAVVETEEPIKHVYIEQPKPKLIKPTKYNRKRLKKGATIKIDKLYFDIDSYEIKKESYPSLNEVYDFLRKNPDVEVEIGGHTNNKPAAIYCDSLSTSRAKAVRDYLVNKGISPSRIKYKGYGKRKPLFSNNTQQGRKRNQRVEIKILRFRE